MRALIYSRVSHDPTGRGKSVEQQTAESQAWARRESWDVVRLVDETGSASRYARGARERWDEVLAAIERSEVDVLVTWEASRATRDLAVYAMLRDACARHHVLWAYSGTVYDLTKREDRFRTGMDALLAEDEAARTSERVQRATRARALAGQPHGRIPYGYRRQHDPNTGAVSQHPDPETAPIVRRMHAELAAGGTLYGIAKGLTRDGVPTPRPTRNGWLPATILRILTNPAHAGQRVHQGQVVGPAAWEAIVDDNTWHATQAALADPTRPKRPDTTVRHLLSGIAACGVCDGPLYLVRPRGYATYTCRDGGCTARSQRLLDPYVTDRVVEILQRRAADITTVDTTPDVTAAADDLNGLRARLAGFTTAAADGQVTPGSLAAIEARLLPQIRAAEQRLRVLRTPSRLAGIDLSTPAQSWPAWSIATRRTVVRETVDIRLLPVVHPGRRGVIQDGTVLVTPRW